MNESDSS